MNSGELEAARRELALAERLWPGASNLRQSGFTLEYRYGDPAAAQNLLESGELGSPPTPSQRSFLQARATPSRENIERAIVDARNAYRREGSIYHFVQTLATFGRQKEILETLLSADPRSFPGVIHVFFRIPFAQVRRDVRFMAVADRFGLTGFWRVSGKWPDFCFEPDLPYDCKAEAAKLAA